MMENEGDACGRKWPIYEFVLHLYLLYLLLSYVVKVNESESKIVEGKDSREKMIVYLAS